MAQATAEDTLTHLTRLTQKPGVQSTLILSRADGAIVRTSGLLSAEESAASESTHPATATSPVSSSLNPNLNGAAPQSPSSNNNITNSGNSGGSKADVRPGSSSGGGAGPGASRGLKNAEEVARVVWSVFAAAGGAVEQLMGTEDEVKLLRLRTRRNELVVVPDPKFILVVIHETPPA